MKKLTIFPSPTTRIEFPLEDGNVRIFWDIEDESVGSYQYMDVKTIEHWAVATGSPGSLGQLARLAKAFLTFWKLGISGVCGRVSANMEILSRFPDVQLRFLEKMWESKEVDQD